jgi:hypothetical protein
VIWFLTFAFFLASAFFNMLGFWSYSNALLFTGIFNGVIKFIGGGIIYILFSIYFLSPLFLSLSFELWKEMYNTNIFYMVYIVILFGCSFIPGFKLFKRKYLARLKAIGYFRNQRDRYH